MTKLSYPLKQGAKIDKLPPLFVQPAEQGYYVVGSDGKPVAAVLDENVAAMFAAMPEFLNSLDEITTAGLCDIADSLDPKGYHQLSEAEPNSPVLLRLGLYALISKGKRATLQQED